MQPNTYDLEPGDRWYDEDDWVTDDAIGSGPMAPTGYDEDDVIS